MAPNQTYILVSGIITVWEEYWHGAKVTCTSKYFDQVFVKFDIITSMGD